MKCALRNRILSYRTQLAPRPLCSGSRSKNSASECSLTRCSFPRKDSPSALLCSLLPVAPDVSWSPWDIQDRALHGRYVQYLSCLRKKRHALSVPCKVTPHNSQSHRALRGRLRAKEKREANVIPGGNGREERLVCSSPLPSAFSTRGAPVPVFCPSTRVVAREAA
jgi:hypothetical protein